MADDSDGCAIGCLVIALVIGILILFPEIVKGIMILIVASLIWGVFGLIITYFKKDD